MNDALTLARWSKKSIQKIPVERMGLPVRIVHGAEDEGIQSFGELQTTPIDTLRQMPGLGPKSIQQYQKRLKLIEDLCSSDIHIHSLVDWMRQFLRPDEFEVLSLRYGLYRTESGGSSNFYSLQEIANRTGRTRERIRQVEKSALSMLSRELPQAGLQAAGRELITFLHQQHRTLLWNEFDTIGSAGWAGSTTLSAMAFFIFSQTGFNGCLNETFVSSFNESEVQDIHEQLLRQTVPLRPLSTCLVQIPEPSVKPSDLEKICKAISLRSPDFILTKDHQSGPTFPALTHLISRLILQEKKPLHFREITLKINQELPPIKQQGAGRILEVLNQGGFKKITSGVYDCLHSIDD